MSGSSEILIQNTVQNLSVHVSLTLHKVPVYQRNPGLLKTGPLTDGWFTEALSPKSPGLSRKLQE